MHQDSGHGGSCGIYDEFIDEHHRQCERVASGVRAMREGGPWRQGILIFEGVAASSESVDPAARGGQGGLFLPIAVRHARGRPPAAAKGHAE